MLYRFKHFLVQEGVYDLMLVSQRMELHSQVARWLEQNEESSSNYQLMAHHWRAGNNIPKTIEYLDKAAKGAVTAHASKEVIQLLTDCLKLVGVMQKDLDSRGGSKLRELHKMPTYDSLRKPSGGKLGLKKSTTNGSPMGKKKSKQQNKYAPLQTEDEIEASNALLASTTEVIIVLSSLFTVVIYFCHLPSSFTVVTYRRHLPPSFTVVIDHLLL